jgi:hypothetical protein
MQLIVVAMLVGSSSALVIFAAIQGQRPARPADAVPLVSYIGVAFAGFMLLLSFLMPLVTVAAARTRIARGSFGDPQMVIPPDDRGKLLEVYQTALILGAALLEGSTFFLAIAYFLEGLVLDLVAAGVLLGALAARFPTRARVVGWLERQLDLIARVRRTPA